MKKAQTVIELLITYGWTILIILIFLVLLYYYNAFRPLQVIPESCNFGSYTTCTTFKFQQNNPTSSNSTLLLVLSNGLGYDIAFENGTAILTTEGVGKIGKWNYVGTCKPVRFLIKGGDQFLCKFDINDTEAVPSSGRNYKFQVQIPYINCESGPCHVCTHGCINGLKKTLYGEVIAKYQPYTYLEYCGNGFCNATAGENESTCSMDCQPSVVIPFINITSPVNTGYYHKLAVPLNFTSNPSGISVGYCLDGGSCICVQGNTSIRGLLDGTHNITMYGDWNFSSTVIFRYCLADIDGGGRRDSTDMGIISARWDCNCTNGCPSGPWDAEASNVDLNDDCVVDNKDLDILTSLWYKFC